MQEDNNKVNPRIKNSVKHYVNGILFLFICIILFLILFVRIDGLKNYDKYIHRKLQKKYIDEGKKFLLEGRYLDSWYYLEDAYYEYDRLTDNCYQQFIDNLKSNKKLINEINKSHSIYKVCL